MERTAEYPGTGPSQTHTTYRWNHLGKHLCRIYMALLVNENSLTSFQSFFLINSHKQMSCEVALGVKI